ncbi:MAG: ABC transporter ATP-binding protein [Thermodesulfobacteriota bacterium]|nr:ABC transporter ATP-binding protein [Thermodesulfobacteriota bacterium]
MSNEVVISVQNLSKRYRIGAREKASNNFREALVDGFKAPIRNFSRLRKLTKFEDNMSTESPLPHPRSTGAPRSMPSSKRDDIIWALRDISFEVKEGEILGIIGRNGAGKSTLLKILSRITEPTSGDVRLFGRVATLLEVGTGFHPELTGRENIYLNGAILGMRKGEMDRKFDEIVDFAEIDKFLDTPVKRYSSGMYVRLAFAVAAHLDPEILLIDEVLAVGDSAFQRKCLGKMDGVAKEGRTVIFVSHNMGTIRSLCARSILLVDGTVAADSASHHVVDMYLSSFNAQNAPQGEVRWTEAEQAPGCDELRLRSIRLLTTTGEVKNTFDVEKPILIEITYQTYRPLYGMRIVIQLRTQEGEIAFASTDQCQRPDKSERGQYRSTVAIPGGLLNHIRYFLLVQIGIPGVRVLVRGQEYLVFTCVRQNSKSSYVSMTWPGVLAPDLDWSIEKLD